MPYTIEAHFDPATDATVRAVWTELHRAGITSRPDGPHRFPHLTFLYGERDAAASCDWGPVLPIGAVPLQFAALGTFAPGSSTVILAPVLTPRLRQLHQLLFDTFAFTTLSHVCEPEHWFPHCTLASRLTRDKVLAALTALQHLRLPDAATCVSLHLVKYPQAQILSSLTLATPALPGAP